MSINLCFPDSVGAKKNPFLVPTLLYLLNSLFLSQIFRKGSTQIYFIKNIQRLVVWKGANLGD